MVFYKDFQSWENAITAHISNYNNLITIINYNNFLTVSNMSPISC